MTKVITKPFTVWCDDLLNGVFKEVICENMTMKFFIGEEKG